MDRDLLERYLKQGLSLPQIGALMNRDPSMVGYWVNKHGLVANGREKHAPLGGLRKEELEPLIARGLTIRAISESLDVSPSTVRHWMAKFGLRTTRHRANRHIGADRKPSTIVDDCPHHGEAEFILEGRGAYRCKRCRSDAVARWRQRLKRTLIAEAGGACALCGYAGHAAALHFHHLDRSTKQFSLSQEGATRSLARARAEARKCVLLCANCHAEVEAGAASLS
jgi:transposase-like protein